VAELADAQDKGFRYPGGVSRRLKPTASNFKDLEKAAGRLATFEVVLYFMFYFMSP
jgi:hypothetical protein